MHLHGFFGISKYMFLLFSAAINRLMLADVLLSKWQGDKIHPTSTPPALCTNARPMLIIITSLSTQIQAEGHFDAVRLSVLQLASFH
eukprot:CCRYP_007477-RG/>CCRYP_007477-RG protein AED:0.41 eAED:0.56 QI:642/0/0/1/0/0/2/0/86